MQSIMIKQLVLDALLMVAWQRNPNDEVLLYSDQGSQYTSYE
jgi:putative transposase